jgi:hypothetical protein
MVYVFAVTAVAFSGRDSSETPPVRTHRGRRRSQSQPQQDNEFTDRDRPSIPWRAAFSDQDPVPCSDFGKPLCYTASCPEFRGADGCMYCAYLCPHAPSFYK